MVSENEEGGSQRMKTRSAVSTAWSCREREIFIDNLLVRVHLIIEMSLVDLAPWEFEFPLVLQHATGTESLRSVHTNRPHSGGGAATFAGGLPDEPRGKAFCIFPARVPKVRRPPKRTFEVKIHVAWGRTVSENEEDCYRE